MRLTEPLRLDTARVEGYDWQPNENGGKGILTISAPLTSGNAKALDASYLFVTETVPRENAKLAGAKLESIDIEMGRGDNDLRSFSPEVITSITTKSVEDLGIEISFRAHFVGDHDRQMNELVRELKKAEFNLVVRPVVRTQTGPLFDGNSESVGDNQPESEQELGKPRFTATAEGQTNIDYHGKKSQGRITIEACEGGWRAGYEATFSFRHAKVEKSLPSEMLAQPSEHVAIAFAAAKIHAFAKSVEANTLNPRPEQHAAHEMANWAEQYMDADQFIAREPASEEVAEEEQPAEV